MKEKELNNFLADLCGWEYVVEELDNTGGYPETIKHDYLVKDDGNKIKNWSPLTNLSHAFEVLDEYDGGWESWNTGSGDITVYVVGNKRSALNNHEDYEKAIVGAILKAESKSDLLEDIFNNEV